MHWLRARAGAAAAAAAAGRACWRLRSLCCCVCVMWLRREAENEASLPTRDTKPKTFSRLSTADQFRVLQLAN